MISYIRCTPIACKTGRALAAAISRLQGNRCRYYGKVAPHHNTHSNRRRKIVLYGAQCGPGVFYTNNVLQHSTPIANTNNKIEAIRKMKAAAISTPIIVEKHDWERAAHLPISVVFRKKQRHAGNDNPYVVKRGQEIDLEKAARYDYCMEWILKSKEYRVHVFQGRVLIVQKKCKKRGEECDQYIRSSTRGWVLCDCDSPPEGLAELGNKAVAALSLDFGAVDIIQCKRTGVFYVLEVNAAPGLKPEGVEKYASAMVSWDRGVENDHV